MNVCSYFLKINAISPFLWGLPWTLLTHMILYFHQVQHFHKYSLKSCDCLQLILITKCSFTFLLSIAMKSIYSSAFFCLHQVQLFDKHSLTTFKLLQLFLATRFTFLFRIAIDSVDSSAIIAYIKSRISIKIHYPPVNICSSFLSLNTASHFFLGVPPTWLSRHLVLTSSAVFW